MRPLIGITSGFQTSRDSESPAGRLYLASDYSDAVLAAGGLPLPLPVPPEPDEWLIREMLQRVDGLLFTGGPDIDPQRYGEPRHEKTQVLHPRRESFELALFRAADEARIPTLAICLGFQLVHVARGGRLVQHVDDLPLAPAIPHHAEQGRSAWHPVQVEPDSRLASVVQVGRGASERPELEVNSRHHQGVLTEHGGRDLRPVAWAPDGLLEASEDLSGSRFLLAVQWHPENLADRPEHLRLFAALVAASVQPT
ncbi:MAG: gamma-glutamyl-gamma-aminobutyrate hydrolase family protein [Planctomycetota bacterium]